jgi:hypothetical protein
MFDSWAISRKVEIVIEIVGDEIVRRSSIAPARLLRDLKKSQAATRENAFDAFGDVVMDTVIGTSWKGRHSLTYQLRNPFCCRNKKGSRIAASSTVTKLTAAWRKIFSWPEYRPNETAIGGIKMVRTGKINALR